MAAVQSDAAEWQGGRGGARAFCLQPLPCVVDTLSSMHVDGGQRQMTWAIGASEPAGGGRRGGS